MLLIDSQTTPIGKIRFQSYRVALGLPSVEAGPEHGEWRDHAIVALGCLLGLLHHLLLRLSWNCAM